MTDHPPLVTQPPVRWQSTGAYEDILFERSDEGIARIRINRPAKRNAFRPRTVQELCDAFSRVRDDTSIGVVLFTGAGPAADGVWAFCAGGDQSVRGDGGYV
ncbi:MAG: enoyl-CoA hydratase-related protein, partial [Synechococcaceae cyanobacterium]|nr:enoyl-CoA hydratase-related protein [Synechococcaceae cyanobacterium]